jgi:hypothetical protein
MWAGLAALAILLASGPAALAEEAPATLSPGEEELARMLKGRVAGEKIECMPPARTLQSTTIPGTAIVFGRRSSSTIYVQRTQAPQLIDGNSFLVSTTAQPNRFCRMDQFTVVDRLLGFARGAVVFDDFVPYRKAGGQ